MTSNELIETAVKLVERDEQENGASNAIQQAQACALIAIAKELKTIADALHAMKVNASIY
jgi:hypothetical protein